MVNLIRWIKVRRQSDLINTKESILPICDNPYHTNKGILQKWEQLENLRNYAFLKTSPFMYLTFFLFLW